MDKQTLSSNGRAKYTEIEEGRSIKWSYLDKQNLSSNDRANWEPGNETGQTAVGQPKYRNHALLHVFDQSLRYCLIEQIEVLLVETLAIKSISPFQIP